MFTFLLVYNIYQRDLSNATNCRQQPGEYHSTYMRQFCVTGSVWTEHASLGTVGDTEVLYVCAILIMLRSKQLSLCFQKHVVMTLAAIDTDRSDQSNMASQRCGNQHLYEPAHRRCSKMGRGSLGEQRGGIYVL